MKISTIKILTIAVVLLLLVNIAMVIFMLNWRHPGNDKNLHGKRDGPFEMMAKELNMTEEQKAQHQKFRDEYFAIAHPLFDSVRAAKEAFFALLKDTSASDSLINSSARLIEERQMAVDKITFDHFRKVRTIYNSDQQKKYDELIQKMTFRSPGGKRRDSANKNN